jgi:P-type Cu+ transporter
LSETELSYVKNLLRGSNHPLSRRLYEFLPAAEIRIVHDFLELPGKGIEATIDGNYVKIGAASYVEYPEDTKHDQTAVHICINGNYRGRYLFDHQYRKGLEKLFHDLDKNYSIKILSGDNEGERKMLEKILPQNTELIFNQTPEQKLNTIKNLQEAGYNVMMVGDGLNDAGALAQSNVGISISENVNVFSPACDGILDATEFTQIEYFLQLSRKAMSIIKASFTLSLLYNAVGLSFAISGKLSPLVAAIIMPLSTVTIISFVTLASNYYARKLNPKKSKA